MATTNPDVLMAAIAQLGEQVGALQRQVAAVAEDTAALRKHAGSATQPQSRNRKDDVVRRQGRKRGLAAIMARQFWDTMMREFVKEIRERGPLTAAQLHATLDADALDMAEAAFERIDPSLIAEKIEERVHHKRYFSRTLDGRYDAL
jgi:hypothetical protein